MNQTVKVFLYFLALVVLLTVGLVVLVFSIDPSALKPSIEKALAQHGVKANFAGEIHWQFYPNLGLSVAQLSLNPQDQSNADMPLAYVEKIAFSVKVMPLLKRKIEVNGIYVDSAKLNLLVDENGRGNWQSLLDQKTPAVAERESPPSQSNPNAPPEIRVENFDFTGLSLNYQDKQSGESVQIQNFSLIGQNLNFNGETFPVKITVAAQLPNLPSLAAELNSSIALNLTTKQLALKQVEMALAFNKRNFSEGALHLAIDSQINWQDPLSVKTNVNLAEFNLRQLLNDFKIDAPITADPQALTQVSLAFDLNYSPERIALTDVNAKLDDTQLRGKLHLSALTSDKQPNDSAMPWSIQSDWHGDKINLDHYLPPVADTDIEEPSSTTPPQDLPLESLRELDAELAITFDELIVREAAVKKLTAQLHAKKGLITLDKLDAQAFDGKLHSSGAFDARTNTAKLKLNVKVSAIDIGGLAKHFAEIDQLTGNANASVTINSEGKTDQALIAGVIADTEVTSDNITVAPFNLEQQYCKLLATLDKRELPETNWNAFTRLQPVSLKANYRNDQVTLTNLTAEIEKLTTQAKGELNLATGRFNFPIDIGLGNFSADLQTCGKIDEKWRKQIIPLRCKGDLAAIGADTCLPDADRIRDMVQAAAKVKIDQAKQKLEQKVDTKIEKKKDEVEDKAKSKAESELERLKKKSNNKELNEKLKDIFK